MTQLEILNLAYDAALNHWNYYHNIIEDLKKKGRTNALLEYIEEEWSRKIKEISGMTGMILREGLDDGLKEGDETVKKVTTAFAEKL